MTQWINQSAAWLTRRPLLLLAALYLGLAVVALAADRTLPDHYHRAVDALMGGRGLGAADPALFGRDGRPMSVPDASLWAIAAVAMVSAGLLALPMAWLYTITRQKRGYQQSVVHTLILLPVIVAGVVVLVKYSLALAFSLAGIVAAVRFRNTLEDSKDAVYIFVATGIGLAAGVELSVAVTLSVVYNLATLMLFQSDFGRTPARLEGEMAEERMQRALDMANRTGQFVARLDREVLEDMAPEQLEAVADRAWKRRREAGDRGGGYDAVARVYTGGAPEARVAAEKVLRLMTKRWQFKGASTPQAGGEVLEYLVRLRKSVSPTSLLDALRAETSAGILDAELS